MAHSFFTWLNATFSLEIPLLRLEMFPPAFSAVVAFTLFFALVHTGSRILKRHQARLHTASIWVPLVSGLALYFPLLFIVFITLISYKCMVEYRTILREVYTRQFSAQVANEDFLVRVCAVAIGLACCTGDFSTLLRVSSCSMLCILIVHAARWPEHMPQLFLLDFFGLFWAPFCLNVGALTISVDSGSGFMVMFLWLSWFGDAGAYFVGQKLGRNKCFPHVSPGKTWEGLIAEFVFFVLMTIGLHEFKHVEWIQLPNLSWVMFVALGVALAAFGVCGDLVESLIKRIGNKKDSGDFFTGHGGCLDRFDSFFLASPVLYFGSLTVFGPR